MEKINYIPLGSVVLLEGGIQKLLVISRGLRVSNNGEEFFFDYGGVLYPQGLTGDRMAYFNHKNIAKVVFEGYDDEESRIVSDNINKFLEAHPETKYGSAESFKE